MKSTEDGDEKWDPFTTYLRFERRIRRRTQRRAAARGVVVPLDQVHEHPETQDIFQRACEVVLRALRDWQPGKGLDQEKWIEFRLKNTEPDSSWFDGPLSYPRGVISDYLASVASSQDVREQRAEWEARGHDPVDFDTIDLSQAYYEPRLSNDWSGIEDDVDEEVAAIPDQAPSVESEALGRIFTTLDLTEVERRVWKYRHRGFTNYYIGTVLLPHHLFERSEDDSVSRIESAISRIYSRAKAKAEAFGHIDGTAL